MALETYCHLVPIKSHVAWTSFCCVLENYTKKMFQMLNSAYSTISVADVAHFLGMSEDRAIDCTQSDGYFRCS